METNQRKRRRKPIVGPHSILVTFSDGSTEYVWLSDYVLPNFDYDPNAIEEFEARYVVPAVRLAGLNSDDLEDWWFEAPASNS